MPVITFTEADLELYLSQQRLECVVEHAERAHLIHAAFLADPEVDVHTLARQGRDLLAEVRQKLYAEGRLDRGSHYLVKMLYQSILN
jgi:hypothetical protein